MKDNKMTNTPCQDSFLEVSLECGETHLENDIAAQTTVAKLRETSPSKNCGWSRMTISNSHRLPYRSGYRIVTPGGMRRRMQLSLRDTQRPRSIARHSCQD